MDTSVEHRHLSREPEMLIGVTVLGVDVVVVVVVRRAVGHIDVPHAGVLGRVCA